MGRKKKKPFIDKKKAQTFSLVPRSQHDPLAGDATQAQYVLKPEATTKGVNGDEGDRLKQQQKFGIFYEDEYDYMQHLKTPGMAVLELTGSGPGPANKKVSLPEELFGSEVTVQGGQLDKVLPVSGPRPDWDPEIVEALEDAEVCGEEVQQLEDDFIILANGGEPGLPVFITEQDDDKYNDAPWWKDKGNFDYSQPLECPGNEESSDCLEEESSSSLVGSMECNRDTGNRTAGFTDYSMTSSVIPRSEALTLLDDQFEEFMVSYNDDQIGAGEVEGAAEGTCPNPQHAEYDQLLLQTALKDFEKNFQEDSKQMGGDGGRERKETDSGSEVGSDDEPVDKESSDDGGSSEGEERVLMEMDGTNKRERWDCESILSTYSTLYNHPTKIVEPSTKIHHHDEIKLSRKTGIPIGVIPGPLPKENHPKRTTITRPRNEDKDDRRARKLAMKEDRRQRRTNKKATKMIFKAEALKQEKQSFNTSVNMAAVV